MANNNHTHSVNGCNPNEIGTTNDKADTANNYNGCSYCVTHENGEKYS